MHLIPSRLQHLYFLWTEGRFDFSRRLEGLVAPPLQDGAWYPGYLCKQKLPCRNGVAHWGHRAALGNSAHRGPALRIERTA